MNPSLPLGAIIAGGRSRRFGSAKQTADLQGKPLIRWVYDAVSAAVPAPVCIGDDPATTGISGARRRPDARPGSGPIGGIHTALLWAKEDGRPGALCVACDTPFLPSGLLQRLVDRFGRSDADVVAAASGGPLGMEPLCAVYRISCLPEIERRIASGEHGLGRLLHALDAECLPLHEVERFGDPEILFLNINTPEHHARALEIVRRGVSPFAER